MPSAFSFHGTPDTQAPHTRTAMLSVARRHLSGIRGQVLASLFGGRNLQTDDIMFWAKCLKRTPRRFVITWRT